MIRANHDHWKQKKLWTISELAFLLKGFEPARRELDHPIYQKHEPQFDEVDDLIAMLNDIAARDPNIRVKNRNNPTGYWAPTEPIDYRKLLSWVAGIDTVEMPKELAVLFVNKDQSLGNAAWPYKYDTNLLTICRWVIENHWEGRNPNSAPKREVMIRELQKKFKISKGAALAIDHVTRDDSLKATPKKIHP